jgi:hypothetical protein
MTARRSSPRDDNRAVPDARVKVLYVAGVPRCGSTILGALLGQVEGVFFAGEVVQTANVVERGISCGCGEPLESCPVWGGVFARAFPADGRDRPTMLHLSRRDGRAVGVARHVLRARGLLPASPALERVTKAFADTFVALQEETGARVVVDSSKSPAYARLLQNDPRIDLHVLHLVRDPRATTWSWLRDPLIHDRPSTVALIWDFWNPLIELLWRRSRYLRLRYEDFASEPERAVRRILELVGERPDALPFVSPDEVLLAPTHSVHGNPNRFRSGPVEIALDDSWLRAPEFRGRRIVTWLTAPLRLRY